MNTARNADRGAQVTLRFTGREYRTLVRELEYYESQLKAEYGANAVNWGDQNTDRIAFANRLQRLRDLVKVIS